MDAFGASLTPLRVSLAGGGTDLPSYADRAGGNVISFAIDRYVAVSLFPRWFDVDPKAPIHDALAKDPAIHQQDELVRTALQVIRPQSRCQFASMSDVPHGCGLGGSAAVLVGLLAANGKPGAHTSAVELAERAAAIEMREANRSVGKHDHYICALGGMQELVIAKDQTVAARSVTVTPTVKEYIRSRLLLFFTGTTRDASTVLNDQDARTSNGDRATVAQLKAIHALVDPMRAALETSEVDAIGPLLHRHWAAKRALSSSVSSEFIDKAYEAAIDNGADGGKVLGAGGGGFLLISARQGTQDAIREELTINRGMTELLFDFEPVGVRSKLFAI